jgi:RNA polymerase sigma factor (sigma-70 family)
VQDFTSYERLFWRTLARLAHGGHFVPPDESRDVIHDFYVEAWSRLLTHFDPSRGAFPAYVAGAFHKFARRRLVEHDAWRSRLVDIDVVLEHASDVPSPVEQAESSQELERIRVALDSLPGVQRQILVSYMAGERPSERRVALSQHTSRHAVRQVLVQALANLATAFEQAGASKRDALVVQLAWRDGRVSPDIANRAHVSTREVQLTRQHFARHLLVVACKYNRVEGRLSTMAIPELLKNALFDEDRARARAVIAEHSERLRHWLLTAEGDMRLTHDEEAFLRQHPDRLGELYDYLHPESDAHQDSLTEAIARFEGDQMAELAEAFESMVYCLPDELKDWRSILPAVRLDERQVSFVKSKPVMRRAGKHALELIEFGLTPEVFAETFGGMSLLFEQAAEGGYAFDDDDQLCLELVHGDALAAIGFNGLLGETMSTPGLPENDQLARRLTNWTLQALAVLPLLIPGYEISVREGQVPLVKPYEGNELTLSTRWTRRAQEPRSASRPRIRF